MIRTIFLPDSTDAAILKLARKSGKSFSRLMFLMCRDSNSGWRKQLDNWDFPSSRPDPELDPERIHLVWRVRDLKKQGYSVRQIAQNLKDMKVTRDKVWRILRKFPVE